MSYTVMKDGKTYAELSAEISAMTQEDEWLSVFLILYPFKQYDNKATDETGEDFYNLIDVYQEVAGEKVLATKLPYADFQAEFLEHQAELQSALTEWFDDAQYAYDAGLWWDALKHYSQSIKDADGFNKYNTANPMKVLQEIIKNKDDELRSLIDFHDAVAESNHQFEKSVNEKMERMRLGQRIIAIINHLNEEKDISVEDLTALLSSVEIQQIMALLQTGSLLTARGAIAAVDISVLPPLVQSDIDKILGELDSYLGV